MLQALATVGPSISIRLAGSSLAIVVGGLMYGLLNGKLAELGKCIFLAGAIAFLEHIG